MFRNEMSRRPITRSKRPCTVRTSSAPGSCRDRQDDEVCHEPQVGVTIGSGISPKECGHSSRKSKGSLARYLLSCFRRGADADDVVVHTVEDADDVVVHTVEGRKPTNYDDSSSQVSAWKHDRTLEKVIYANLFEYTIL